MLYMVNMVDSLTDKSKERTGANIVVRGKISLVLKCCVSFLYVSDVHDDGTRP